MRQLGAMAAIVIIVGTLYTLVLRYNGTACLGEHRSLELYLFLALTFLFSISVVWLMAIPISVLVSRVVKTGIAAHLLTLSLAVSVHFSIGAVGWVIFRDVPGFSRAGWFFLWIVGVLFKLDVLRECM